MISDLNIFNVKYCPFTSIFGALSFYSISYKQKKDFTGNPNISVSGKMRSNQFSYVNDVNNVPK